MDIIKGTSVHATRMIKVIEIVWKVLNPFNAQGKLTKVFVFLLITHINFLVGIGSYLLTSGLTNLTPTELLENVGVFLAIVRHCVYLTMMVLLRTRIQAVIDKIVKTREQLQSTDDDWTLSIDYMKSEFRVTRFSVVGIILYNLLLSCGVFFIKDVNKHQLPYNFYFVYFPFDSFMTPKWFVHYIQQLIMANAAVLLYYSYSGYTLLIMNFSCWEVDALRLQVKKMFQQKENLDFKVKQTILRSYRVMDFLQEAQAIFRVSFLTDFSLSAFIFCMCFYTLSSDVFGSMSIFVIICLLFSQLSIFCWMGNRVNVCIENLYVAVYEVKWYSQSVRHQNDLLMILIMAQRLKGFNGIFNSVDLQTLLKILQFTYSLLAFLQTTN